VSTHDAILVIAAAAVVIACILVFRR